LAEKYFGMGYHNTKALKGGVDAWKRKGYPLHRVF
jgi:rhodanese-related sulfurtransferase